MADEEQGTPVSQDPAQPAAPVAPAAPAAQVGPGPWQAQLQQSFDPQTAAQVDAFLRSHVQPYVTTQEQRARELQEQYESTAPAREMLEAFQRDPVAANVAVNRELYGNEYGDQLAASLGRTDLLVAQPQTQPAVQQQSAAADPKYEEMYNDWAERRAQEQYTAAKADFLTDPQYADIDSELFDPFVASAETWEDAVNSYRAWAAHYAERNAPESPAPALAPPVIGSETGGAPGSTPALPRETLDQAIDAIFSENKPIAPPVIGQ